MGRKQDSFRQDLVSFISIILRSLVIFAEQFLSALVGCSGNGGLAFAPLPDADTEMWAGDLSLTVLSFGVAGLPVQGLFLASLGQLRNSRLPALPLGRLVCSARFRLASSRTAGARLRALAGCSAEHPAQSGGGSRNVRLAERNGTG